MSGLNLQGKESVIKSSFVPLSCIVVFSYSRISF